MGGRWRRGEWSQCVAIGRLVCLSEGLSRGRGLGVDGEASARVDLILDEALINHWPIRNFVPGGWDEG